MVQSGRLEHKVRDSCGSSGTGETPQAKPRRLTARPAESEHALRSKSAGALSAPFVLQLPKLRTLYL
ncbi:hypothetical protein CUU66_08575 [Peribacillus deserti]|uniref:Uncharacterized protein n=1 Tax=Peribacillus deserti TaxID=673318 RepID=A0A2N5M7E9_9BACI|nr:hypothetical protein CUU66_08575 [Peribacillus deserti]